jgi:hypothetical protein
MRIWRGQLGIINNQLVEIKSYREEEWRRWYWRETIGYYTTINWRGILQGQRICQWYWRGTTQHHAKVKWDDEAIYNNGTEGDDSASYNKALCNNQFDEAWDGTLMRRRDIVRQSDMWGGLTTKFDVSALCNTKLTRTKDNWTLITISIKTWGM